MKITNRPDPNLEFIPDKIASLEQRSIDADWHGHVDEARRLRNLASYYRNQIERGELWETKF